VLLLLVDGALAFDWDDELLAKTVWPERAPEVAKAGATANLGATG
jgi:H+-translocating NAD(P) transhydrogenase subunit alpha